MATAVIGGVIVTGTVEEINQLITLSNTTIKTASGTES